MDNDLRTSFQGLTCSEFDCTAASYSKNLCKWHYAVMRKQELWKRGQRVKEIVKKEKKQTAHRTMAALLFRAQRREATLHFELYHALKQRNIQCIAEFRDGNNRYDLLVFSKHGKVAAVVEVKGDGGKLSKKQSDNYPLNSFKAPVIVLSGLDAFWSVFEKIVKLTH